MNTCSVCKSCNSTKLCRHCKVQVYCSDKCAQLDWNRHALVEHCTSENLADEIIPGLWLGSIDALSNIDQFDAIVSALAPGTNSFEALKLLVKNKPHYIVPIDDVPKAHIDAYFEPVAEFIHVHLMHGHRVLVHCMAGHSRSVSLVAYYLMKTQGIGAKQALKLIKMHRPTIRPNSGFKKQLRKAEKALRNA